MIMQMLCVMCNIHTNNTRFNTTTTTNNKYYHNKTHKTNNKNNNIKNANTYITIL